MAACWYRDPAFAVELNFTDALAHRLAIYCLDWDTSLRAQTIDVLDAATGAALDSQSIRDFSGGRYLVWDLQGHLA